MPGATQQHATDRQLCLLLYQRQQSCCDGCIWQAAPTASMLLKQSVWVHVLRRSFAGLSEVSRSPWALGCTAHLPCLTGRPPSCCSSGWA